MAQTVLPCRVEWGESRITKDRSGYHGEFCKLLFIVRVLNGTVTRRKGAPMENNITHLSQLKELHQNIVNTPGHCPSQRWELWERINRAEALLEDAGADSEYTNQRSFAADKWAGCRRLSYSLAILALTLFLLGVASLAVHKHMPSGMSTAFAGTAAVTGIAATLFAARADDYHKIIRLLDSAHEFEPRIIEKPIEVAFEEDDGYEWVWVYEDEEAPVNAPIFNAGLQVPLLTV